MTSFRRLDVSPGQARVGAGVLLREVQAAAAASGQFYAPDPTENTSSIGGNIARQRQRLAQLPLWRHAGACAGAARGPDGRHASSNTAAGKPWISTFPRIPLPRSTKHSAGYRLAPGMDFVDLFIGSEGTLGVVTEAELQLLPAPKEIMGGVVFFPSEDAALDAVDRWRPVPGLRMLEYLDRGSLEIMEVPQAAAVMVEQEGEIDLDMAGALEDDSWFGTSPSDRERFRRFRHGLGERVNERIRRGGYMKLGTDYAVPRDKGREIIRIYRRRLDRDLGLPYVIYGHMGDAHLHINTFPASKEEFARAKAVLDDLAEPVVELGGTVGAEHGLGKRKAHLLPVQYGPEVIEAMRAVKRRFDPQWLLGRGNLFDAPAASQ